jgi:hypothetical protein
MALMTTHSCFWPSLCSSMQLMKGRPGNYDIKGTKKDDLGTEMTELP